MDIITDAEYRRQIKSKPAAGYLFFGEEDYLKAHARLTARREICPDEALAPFNNPRLDGLDFDSQTLMGVLSTLPMMAERKLVEVTGLNFGAMKPSEIEELCDTVSHLEEYDYNVLIISVSAGCIDEGYLPKRPSALLKKLARHLTPVSFTRSTPAMLARWVQKHFEHNGVSAAPEICARLTDFCGQNMFTLAGEIDKLSWYLLSRGRTDLTDADIIAAVPDTGYDAFAFANAVTDCRRNDALNILGEMKRRRIEPTVIMGEIIHTFCNMMSVRLLIDSGCRPDEISSRLKLHEYKVKLLMRSAASAERLRQIISLCTDTDAALKLSPQGYSAIERLICAF